MDYSEAVKALGGFEKYAKIHGLSRMTGYNRQRYNGFPALDSIKAEAEKTRKLLKKQGIEVSLVDLLGF